MDTRAGGGPSQVGTRRIVAVPQRASLARRILVVSAAGAAAITSVLAALAFLFRKMLT